MAFPCNNLSQVKLNIKKVITNLELLNNCANDDIVGIGNLKFETEGLLRKLEKSPLERYKNKKKKRLRKKHHKNVTKLDEQQNNNLNKQIVVGSSEISKKYLGETKQGLGRNHSESIKECKRFLQTFELLEQLHLSRGNNSSQSYKFAMKFRQLKSIWNCLLQDKLQEETSIDVTIQEQWNEVFFGPSEKTYFHLKPELQDFLQKRQIWDSYIDSKHGSSIPRGWIVPNEQVQQPWQAYKATSNI